MAELNIAANSLVQLLDCRQLIACVNHLLFQGQSLHPRRGIVVCHSHICPFFQPEMPENHRNIKPQLSLMSDTQYADNSVYGIKTL